MSVEEALEVLREIIPVPQTKRNDHLTPREVAIRDAFAVIERRLTEHE